MRKAKITAIYDDGRKVTTEFPFVSVVVLGMQIHSFLNANGPLPKSLHVEFVT